MKALKRKPEQILAERFDGTPESAKKIVDWMKHCEDERVTYYNLRLKEERFPLGADGSYVPESIGNNPELVISTTKARYFLTPGNWMVLVVDEGTFKTSYDDYIAKHYDEI